MSVKPFNFTEFTVLLFQQLTTEHMQASYLLLTLPDTIIIPYQTVIGHVVLVLRSKAIVLNIIHFITHTQFYYYSCNNLLSFTNKQLNYCTTCYILLTNRYFKFITIKFLGTIDLELLYRKYYYKLDRQKQAIRTTLV